MGNWTQGVKMGDKVIVFSVSLPLKRSVVCLETKRRLNLAGIDSNQH